MGGGGGVAISARELDVGGGVDDPTPDDAPVVPRRPVAVARAAAQATALAALVPVEV